MTADAGSKIKVLINAVNNKFQDYFTGNDTLEIDSKGVGAYEITYLPLTMTVNE